MWRDLLGRIIAAPQERQRIANELGVSPITLTRWVTGESRPRLQNFKLLLHVLPEHRATFLHFLAEEFGRTFTDDIEIDTIPNEIASAFYAQIFRAHCTLPRVTHHPALCHLILTQAAQQLDPNQAGLQVAFIQCISFDSIQVRSLRERMVRGSYPLKGEFEHLSFFLGCESLAGFVVTGCETMVVGCRRQESILYNSLWHEWGESAIACPLLRSNKIAGCLLVSSMLTDYFLLPSRRQLVQRYADLLTAVLDANMFYTQEQVQLGRMPAPAIQTPYLELMRQHVIEVMLQQQCDMRQAERVVLGDIEEQLFAVTLSPV